ncbi:MAG: efflux RND transporter permease subunit [Bacteroidales bacterium]
MSIYKSAVHKPITTIMLFLAIIVFGLYSLSRLPIDLYPEMEPPFISIITTYSGASASDIETNVTRTIEDALSSVDNMEDITSRSLDNMSVVFVEFEWGTNLDEASNDIRNSLSFVENYLPDDSEDPIIYKFNTSMMPILFYGITADESYEGIENILDDKLVNRLNKIEGIGSIGFQGFPTREIVVEVDPQKLESYNLTINDIGSVIQAENFNLPGGTVKMGNLQYSLRVEGEFETSDVIENIVIGSFNQKNIYIDDVARVIDGPKEKTLSQKINGENGIRMSVMKQSGANTVEISDKVKKELTEIKKDLPQDIEIIEIFDSSKFINNSISNLTETLMWALIFVTLVVLFFLGRWRATFIIVLTIPIALIVSFIYLHLTGNSINIISLSALSIAIGMVVDDAIVVLENISKHIERGARPREAAIYATNEVWLAVIVTTLTVVAVFLPLTMITGMTGVLFKQLGWIVTITVVTSTVAAISLTPMLSSLMLRLRKKNKKPKKISYDNLILPFLDKLDVFYEKIISKALHNKKKIIFSAIGIFALSLFLITQVGTEFIPESDQSSINATIELQSGTRLEKTMDVAHSISESFKKKHPEIELISSTSGSNDEGGVSSLFNENGSHIINLQIRLNDPKNRNNTVWEIAESMRGDLTSIPEIENYELSTEGGGGFGGGNNISIEIYGYSIDKTNHIAQQIVDSLETINGAKDITISRKKAKPELQVKLDQGKLADNQLTTATVASALRNSVYGMTASKFREDGDEYDIIVKFPEENRSSITDIENIAVKNMNGSFVRIKEIGKVIEHWSPPNIERSNRQRIVTVSTTPYGISLGDLSTEIQKKLDSIETPTGVTITLGGGFEDMQESFADMGLLMLLVLVLVYIVMAAQFESLKMPFIIMFSIPFAFSGVFIALFITGKTFSIIAALGAIMLIGIVVKNAIVLVDYINLLRERGYDLNDAITESGRLRLRPVLMTAATTILGMLPMALSTGEGSEIWSPMGIAVIGGLFFSTIITLIIVPIGYSILVHRTSKNETKAIQEELEVLEKLK